MQGLVFCYRKSTFYHATMLSFAGTGSTKTAEYVAFSVIIFLALMGIAAVSALVIRYRCRNTKDIACKKAEYSEGN